MRGANVPLNALLLLPKLLSVLLVLTWADESGQRRVASQVDSSTRSSRPVSVRRRQTFSVPHPQSTAASVPQSSRNGLARQQRCHKAANAAMRLYRWKVSEGRCDDIVLLRAWSKEWS